MVARLLCLLLCLATAPGIAAELRGHVTSVRDGDTIVVDTLPVRLQGLHAPELGEPGGHAARAAMVKLALGRPVVCDLTGETSYDRVIGVCFAGGVDLAAALVKLGLGRDCPRYSGGRYAELELPSVADMPLPAYCDP